MTEPDGLFLLHGRAVHLLLDSLLRQPRALFLIFSSSRGHADFQEKTKYISVPVFFKSAVAGTEVHIMHISTEKREHQLVLRYTLWAVILLLRIWHQVGPSPPEEHKMHIGVLSTS